MRGDPLGTFNGTSYSGVMGLLASGYIGWQRHRLHDRWTAKGVTGLAAGRRRRRLLPRRQARPTLYEGQTVDASAVLIKYTYAGDANLDGVIDGADYGTIDNWVQFPGTDGYATATSTYDGVIDGADYGLIDNAIQLQGAPL